MENILDILLGSDFDVPTPKMTSDELQSLDTIRVDFEPDGSEYLGGYFAPYHDVNVYLGPDGKYYSVWFYIGD